MDDKAKASELAAIDDDFNQAILLLSEAELQEKLFLFATLLRLTLEVEGASKRSAADNVLGFLRLGKRSNEGGDYPC